MYCNQCGNIISEGSAFCSFCGAKCGEAVEKAAEPAKPAVSEPDIVVAPAKPVYMSQEQHTENIKKDVGVPVEIPVKPVAEPKVEKYYTLSHLLLCLAAVAVMAIVAGVFAGLYFSSL